MISDRFNRNLRKWSTPDDQWFFQVLRVKETKLLIFHRALYGVSELLVCSAAPSQHSFWIHFALLWRATKLKVNPWNKILLPTCFCLWPQLPQRLVWSHFVSSLIDQRDSRAAFRLYMWTPKWTHAANAQLTEYVWNKFSIQRICLWNPLSLLSRVAIHIWLHSRKHNRTLSYLFRSEVFMYCIQTAEWATVQVPLEFPYRIEFSLSLSFPGPFAGCLR